MNKLGDPVICYVTDWNGLRGNRDIAALRACILGAISAGVNWVQIREKDLRARDSCELVKAVTEEARRASSGRTLRTRILVNDRLDVALAAGADGVHLGGTSLPIAAINEWRHVGVLPAGFQLGVSCHSFAEVEAAERDGADYIFFGPVFATPSKEEFGAPQGIERLAQASSSVKIPVIAIGGIRVENARLCVQAGAAGIAAIRMFQETTDLHGTVGMLRERMKASAADIGN
ncbi:MAG TPA: thiamine phosphate synthase [Candidatus Acidoferrales bacterium]|nr:thiamine phosphate synthase [Candidatus Acidoferrales bacterium]